MITTEQRRNGERVGETIRKQYQRVEIINALKRFREQHEPIETVDRGYVFFPGFGTFEL